jgi:hypothetical protein
MASNFLRTVAWPTFLGLKNNKSIDSQENILKNKIKNKNKK